MIPADQRLGQPFLVAVVAVPRVEAQQDGTNSKGLDFSQLPIRVLRPWADCEANAVESSLVPVEICFELTVSAAHLCG